MKLRAIAHDVMPEDGGGYWAEVPALPGCASQGDSWDELLANTRAAIEGCSPSFERRLLFVARPRRQRKQERKHDPSDQPSHVR